MLGFDRSGASDAPWRGSAVRPPWWTQVVLVGTVLWAYDAVNNLNSFKHASALAHGVDIVHLEARLHLEPELWLNHWLGAHLGLGRLLGDYYDTAHLVATFAVLIWVWWRHPSRYRLLRNALLGINAVGFVVFWVFPVAPPRMLSGLGFVDIVAIAHSVGAWSSGTLGSQANEYAAMPSLHVAWALWCAWAVWLIRKEPFSRAVAASYAAATAIVVLATANHYFLDVAGGVATALMAAGCAGTIERRLPPARPPGGGARAPGGPPLRSVGRQ